MTGKFLGSILVGMLACPIAANAQNVVGDWQGNVVYHGGPEAGSPLTLTLDVTSEKRFLGAELVSGKFEITCAAGAPAHCGTGGFDSFTGYLSSTGLLLDGSLVFGRLSSGDSSIKGAGLDKSGAFTWSANKISAPEIDRTQAASALMLLIGGFAVVRAGRSRSRLQAV